MKKTIVVFFCVVLLQSVLVVSDCQAQAKPAPIKIGVLSDYTGVGADYGPKWRQAQELYLSEIGSQVAGKMIKIITEDSATSPDTAIIKAKKLVEFDKVHMLVGTIFGNVSIAVSAYAAQAKIPHIIWYGGHYEAVERGWSFATTPPLEGVGYIGGLYAYGKGYRTITAIGSDYVAGQKIIGVGMQAFIDKGGKVIQKQWVPLGTKDYAPYLGALKMTDALFLWLPAGDAVAFMKQYAQFGLFGKMPIVLPQGDAFWEPYLVQLPPEVVGRVGGQTIYTDGIDTPENKKFVAAFKAKTGRGNPDPHDYTAYESWILITSAFKATKGDTDPEKLRQAIRGLEITTPTGKIRISPKGFVSRSSYAFELQLKDGKIVRTPVGSYPDPGMIRLRPGIVP